MHTVCTRVTTYRYQKRAVSWAPEKKKDLLQSLTFAQGELTRPSAIVVFHTSFTLLQVPSLGKPLLPVICPTAFPTRK